MIRGYLSPGPSRRPFVHALLRLLSIGNRLLDVEFLIDTVADRTVLAPLDAKRLGVDFATLPPGRPSTGVGERVATRTLDAVLTLDSFSAALTLTVLPLSPRALTIPSLLGRDVLAGFALFFEQRTARVLLLTPDEAGRLPLPKSLGGRFLKRVTAHFGANRRGHRLSAGSMSRPMTCIRPGE